MSRLPLDPNYTWQEYGKDIRRSFFAPPEARTRWYRKLWWILTNGQLWAIPVGLWLGAFFYLALLGIAFLFALCSWEFSGLGSIWEDAKHEFAHPDWFLCRALMLATVLLNVLCFCLSKGLHPDAPKEAAGKLSVDSELRQAALQEAFTALPQYRDHPNAGLYYFEWVAQRYPAVAAVWDSEYTDGTPNLTQQVQALRNGTLADVEREALRASRRIGPPPSFWREWAIPLAVALAMTAVSLIFSAYTM